MSIEKCNQCGRPYPYQPGDSVFCTFGCRWDYEEELDRRDAERDTTSAQPEEKKT